MQVLGVIPVRYESTRFPGKPLAEILGKPMLQWVYEGVRKSASIHELVIATDDKRIRKAAEGFGAKVMMTEGAFTSGTDRVASVAQSLRADVIVNIQGDEPLIQESMIDVLIAGLLNDPRADMATLLTRATEDEISKPGCVTAVRDLDDYALYFSRSTIPFLNEDCKDPQIFLKHIGIYAYRKPALLKFTSLPPSPLEAIEGLEQLRALQNGMKVKVVVTHAESIPVDYPEDIQLVERMLKGRMID
jgi:3-deoxy-manno-octulosonate cytidylyltransferase (CMP-KDO synthetase)